MFENLKLAGKVFGVDSKKIDPKIVEGILTLTQQIQVLQDEKNELKQKNEQQREIIKRFRPYRRLIHKMALIFNYQQNNWNEKISSKAKEVLNELHTIKEELGEKPIKLPKLVSKPKPNL